MYKSANQLIVLFLIGIVAIFITIESYIFTHISFSFLILFLLITRKSLNAKMFLGFLLIYYSIPFLNISTYRGTIGFETLKIYTYANFVLIIPIIFSTKLNLLFTKNKTYSEITISPIFILFVMGHLAIIYLILAYIFLTVGNVLIYQELRFQLGAKITYIIKSTLYIPIFLIFMKSEDRFTKKNILIFIILPLFPAFFIGSRGTVMMIIITIILIYLLKAFKRGEPYFLNNNKLWKENKKKVYLSGGIMVFLFQVIYYTRRMFSAELLSNTKLAKHYFGSSKWYYLFIMPIYFSLRETVGITNYIIRKDLSNKWFDYPIFFAEIYTLLPGEQQSPGIALSKGLFTTNYSGGITPGIIGGLYLDYKLNLVYVLFIITMIIYFLYKKSLFSDTYKILYAITIAQFFHLYHRGFVKPEYFVAYLIILFYIFLSKINFSSKGN